MDGDAAPLHAAEPRHLPLGKLMDGYLKTADHLVVGDFAYDVAGEELVFQAVVDEVLGLDAAVEQAAHLVKHTCVKAGVKAPRYFGTGSSTATTDNFRNNNRVFRRIAYTGTFDPQKTYYLRMKSVLENTSTQLFIDYFEWCPKTVYNGVEEEDDW